MRQDDLETCQAIVANRDSLAEKIVARQFSLQSGLTPRNGNVERRLADVKQHLDALSQSIATGRSALFVDYIAWAKVVHAARNIPIDDLTMNLEACYQTLAELPAEHGPLAQQFVLDSLSCLPSLPDATRSFVSPERPLARLAREYLDALLRSDSCEATRLVSEALQNTTSVRDVYLHVFQRSQYEVGRLWQINQITVDEAHECTAATQQIMSQLRPAFSGVDRKDWRMVAACVRGDLHEIGARMVVDFFKMDGWDAEYLGANMRTDTIVNSVAAGKAHVLAISATLLADYSEVQQLIQAVRAHESCRGVCILVGGGPFNIAADLWRDVGADGFAPDGIRAVDLANRLVPPECA